jgi:hypothetical protein
VGDADVDPVGVGVRLADAVGVRAEDRSSALPEHPASEATRSSSIAVQAVRSTVDLTFGGWRCADVTRRFSPPIPLVE